MPPTLRSAQSSPAGKNALFDVSPNVTPGRKTPKCTKCGQPRLGHPRSGCPITDTYNKDSDVHPSETKPKTLQENLDEAFGSMYLEASVAEAEQAGAKGRRSQQSTGTAALQPSETLASISTSAEAILHDLTRPGFFSQEAVSDDDGKGSKGQDEIKPILTPSKFKIKSGPRTLMPGTLKAPSWESSIDGLSDAVMGSGISKVPLEKSSLGVQTSFRGSDIETTSSPPPYAQSSRTSSRSSISARPIQRTQTQEQRHLILSSLSQTSPASIYVHKKQEVDGVEASAKAARLHIQIVYSEDKDEEDVLLVIGSDSRAVVKLAQELADSTKDPAPSTTDSTFISRPSDGERFTSSSVFKAAASGAIVGAVGTWAGLAFS